MQRYGKVYFSLKIETRFWHTFPAEQVVFQNRVFTVVYFRRELAHLRYVLKVQAARIS